MGTFFQNISEQKKRLAIGSGSVLLGAAILITYLSSGPSAETYAQAESAFEKWEASPLDEVLYGEMKQALSSTPALEKKYEAIIAQKLISTGKAGDALSMVFNSLDRVKEEAPFHVTYAKTSLLIEQGEIQQALECAVALKEHIGDLATSLDGGALLYTHNLLRIAFLQQQLKNGPGEKSAWEELESFFAANKLAASIVLGNFSDRKVDLTQYITERKKAL